MNCKAIICLTVLFLSISVFGQKESTLNSVPAPQSESSKGSDNNELRINLLMAILGLPELNYERYISDNMGVGLAVAFSFEKRKLCQHAQCLHLFIVFISEIKKHRVFL